MVNNMQIAQRPFFYDCIINNEDIYFPLANYNALCKGNLKNDQVEIINIFPDIDPHKITAYSGIYKLKHHLLFSPHEKERDFLLYDIKKNEFQILKNKKCIIFNGKKIFQNKNYLYIIPDNVSGIYRMNIENGDFENVSLIGDKIINEEIVNVIQIDKYIYIPLNNKKYMITFDLEKESVKYYKYPESIKNISSINYQDNRFWITGYERKIFSWDMDKNIVDVNAEFPEEIKLFYNRNNWFLNSFIYNDELWLFPGYANMILKFNLSNREIEKINFSEEEEKNDEVMQELGKGIVGRFFPSKYGIVKKMDNTIYFLSSKTRIFYEMDLKTNNIKKHDFKINNLYNYKLYPPSKKGIMLEEHYTGGIKCLLSKTDRRFSIKEEEKGRDVNIYSYLK